MAAVNPHIAPELLRIAVELEQLADDVARQRRRP